MSGKLLNTKDRDNDLINVAANYITVEVPVNCGDRRGRVYVFSKKENLTNGLFDNYASGLTDLVQRRKYFDSKNALYDIGPTIAVANLIDCGEYADFIQQYDKELTGLEHVIKVEENGHAHHLMPPCEDDKFCMKEQLGLIQLSLGLRIITNNDSDSLDVDNELNCWPFKDGNGKKFREEVLPKARVTHFEGYHKDYHNCVIYKDLTETICTNYNLTPAQIVAYQIKLTELSKISKRSGILQR